MVETFAIIMAALPVAVFFAVWVPFSALATLIGGLHEITINPEHLTNLFNSMLTDPELQPEALIEGFKEALQYVIGMQ